VACRRVDVVLPWAFSISNPTFKFVKSTGEPSSETSKSQRINGRHGLGLAGLRLLNLDLNLPSA
jgi:hypothetical protein